MTPRFWVDAEAGDLLLAKNPKFRPPIPGDLLRALNDMSDSVRRIGAVAQLQRLALGEPNGPQASNIRELLRDHLSSGSEDSVQVTKAIEDVLTDLEQSLDVEAADPHHLESEEPQKSSSEEPRNVNREISRRKIFAIATGGVALTGIVTGSIYFRMDTDNPMGSFKRLISPEERIPINQLIRHRDTGVIHHKVICARHLPQESKRVQVQETIRLDTLHRQEFHEQQSLNIFESLAIELANDNAETTAVRLLMEIVDRAPERIHIYDRLIGLLGHLKRYLEIHEMLQASLARLESLRGELEFIDPRRHRAIDKAARALDLRQKLRE